MEPLFSEAYLPFTFDGDLFRTTNRRLKVDMPERYIINENATILFWKNGEKTIVKRCEEDDFNPRLAFLTAFFQHYCGMSKNKANKYLASLEVERKESKVFEQNLKVGDKVIVRKDLKNFERYGTEAFMSAMERFKGNVVTISEIVR